MCVEGIPALAVQLLGYSSEPGQHLHWGNIEIWPLPSPGRHNCVNLVGYGVLASHSGILGARIQFGEHQPLRSASLLGMVTASNRMPAQSAAGTTMAWWRPSCRTTNPIKPGPIKKAA